MYNTYASHYTSYEQVEDQIKTTSGGNTANDKTTIIEAVKDASSMIRGWCFRTFVPYIDTTAQVRYQLNAHRVQELPDDTLSVTSIKDTGDTTIDATTYRLMDIYNGYNGNPARYIEFSFNAQYVYQDSNDFAPTFVIDGIFGYSQRSYADTWLNETALNDGTDINETDTAVIVDSATNIEILDYIRLDSEFMQVTAISDETLTVLRGVNGSTAILHLDNVQVDVWQVDDSVKLACTRLATWLYKSRQNETQTIQFQDGTIAGINYPAVVRQALETYVKPHFVSVR